MLKKISMKPPCVIVVSQILPAIRVLVAKELVTEYDLKPVEAATKMDITPAAITQYVKGIRGKNLIKTVEKSKKAREVISELTNELIKDKVNMIIVLNKMCKACQIIRSEGLICELHEESLPSLEDYKCKICVQETCYRFSLLSQNL